MKYLFHNPNVFQRTTNNRTPGAIRLTPAQIYALLVAAIKYTSFPIIHKTGAPLFVSTDYH